MATGPLPSRGAQRGKGRAGRYKPYRIRSREQGKLKQWLHKPCVFLTPRKKETDKGAPLCPPSLSATFYLPCIGVKVVQELWRSCSGLRKS